MLMTGGRQERAGPPPIAGQDHHLIALLKTMLDESSADQPRGAGYEDAHGKGLGD
jgi:hypothetical protein